MIYLAFASCFDLKIETVYKVPRSMVNRESDMMERQRKYD